MTAEALSLQKNIQDVGHAQREASDPQSSVWVAASAGSGKTKVLADRVTRLLLDGVRPERILCLTFTRAAAAEMAIRLTQRLSRWATCDEAALEQDLDALQNHAPDGARRLFAQVLACAGGMRIQTIHAFAQEILRRFPLEAGLAPHFTVLEESESTALWREAFDDMLEAIAEKPEGKTARAFSTVIQSLGEDSLRSLLRETKAHETALRRALSASGDMDGLVEALRAKLGLSPEDTQGLFCAKASRNDAFAHEKLLGATRLVFEKGSKDFKARAQIILDWLANDECARAAQIETYCEAFFTGKGTPYAKVANVDVLLEAPEIEDVLRTEEARLERLRERLQTVRFAQETEAVLRLAVCMMDGFAAKKQALAAMDYDDLIARTNAVLSRSDIAPWVLYKLDGGIDHILVDESQDTNPQQWRIIESLANEYFSGEGARQDRTRTLFVVGDEKQSIYSFLKADPEEFARMRAHFASRIQAAEKPFREVPLNVSFRSAPAILRAVDAVFADNAVRRGVSRDPVAHSAFRHQGAGRVEVWPLFVSPDAPKKNKTRLKAPEEWEMPLGYEAAHDPVAELAVALAAQIKAWVEAGHSVYDRDLKAERPVAYSDIMVLVQKRRPFVDVFVRALKRAAVPVSGVDRMRLTEQLAVMDVMALLQFALLPEDDLTLATVLRGPLIGASEDELMHLAIGRKGSLWQSLCAKTVGREDIAAWHTYLDKILGLADQIAPLALVVRILIEPCPADAVSGRRALASRLGPDAEDPLDELLNEAESFGLRHPPSLQAFLHWLMSTEFEIKREMEQASGRVRITTVHASKGLEAPIVILPDTMRVPDRQMLAKIVWDEAEGLPFYVPREPLHAGLRRLRDEAYNRQMEESRRLLYVALTRAADRLYVCGFSKTDKQGESANGKETWYSLVRNGLAGLHQDDVERDPHSDVQPEIIVADYAGIRTLRHHEASLQGSGDLSVQGEAGIATSAKGPPRNDGEVELPAWLHRPPAPEPSPPRPLVPSRPSEEEPPTISPQDPRFARGKIIHRLLQSLPDLEAAQREAAAVRFLANPQHGLDRVRQSELCAEVMALLHDVRFAPLFGAESRAEQPIIGLSGERLISGQVDRLALVGEEVWIVDYKTNRPPPDDVALIPRVYREQMEAYRTVLKAIYPARKVRCFLLWTFTLKLMEC